MRKIRQKIMNLKIREKLLRSYLFAIAFTSIAALAGLASMVIISVRYKND